MYRLQWYTTEEEEGVCNTIQQYPWTRDAQCALKINGLKLTGQYGKILPSAE